MHFLTGWFIRNPVAANLMMAFILFLGTMTLVLMRIEGFPRIPPESVQIITSYPDAPAAQVAELVTQKIENSLEGLEGMRSISSESGNAISIVNVRRTGGQDINHLLDKIRLRIDSVSELPAAVKRPVIETTAIDFPALYVNLHGDIDPHTLQKLTERLKEELLAQQELSRLNIWGLHEQEILIAVEPQILQQLNLTISDVVEKIRVNSLDFQAGTLRTVGANVYLRADDKAKFSTEFANIPIIEHADGTTVLLSEISQIHDGFKEGDYLFRFNGSQTTGMEVLIGQKENLLRISEIVHQTVNQFQKQIPPNIKITIWGDSSSYISDRLKLLRSNGIQGLLLVTLLLSIFLNVSLAFWVAMGIPIAIMGAIAVAGSSWVDYSLNDVTTFGLIIALGILVDDAVVIGESVFEEKLKITDPILATEAGVSKVAVATTFGVLTTIAAFYPMLLIDNPLGKVLAGFSGIVIFALLFSWIESKFILPAHLAGLNLNTPSRFIVSRLWAQLQKSANKALLWLRDKYYVPILATTIAHRYSVLILFIAVGTLGLGMLHLGKVKTVFFPDIPGQMITINLEMDARAPFKLSKYNIEKIQTIGQQLNKEYQKQYHLDNPPVRTFFMIISNATSAQIYAELTPVAERSSVGILDIVKAWRHRTASLEGVSELQFTGSEQLAGGFQLKVLAKDRDLLKPVSEEIKAYIRQINGVHNIRDSLSGGQAELEIQLKPEAGNLGFTSEALASQIGYSFGGAEVQKIQRDGKELRVIVQNTRNSRDTIDDLLQSHLRSNKGDWIPFQSVAEVKGHYTETTIHSENAKTVNIVSASVDRTVVAPEEMSQAIFEQLLPELTKKYPTVEIIKAGELEEMGEIRGGMLRALLVSVVMIYILMAVPLKSYWQPLVILAIVPFGFIGAVIGHMIMDLPLSLLSFFGMLALTGVVINDSLVLISRYNQNREHGNNPSKALQNAGAARFRAIFLTTATTVIGLLPLLLETSEQAQYLIPAAVSLAFGELFSTLLMLVLVPVLISISEDIKLR